jgi:hypothetical protein
MSYLRLLGAALVFAGSAQLTSAVHAEPPQPIVVPAMQKDLADMPGREMIMLTVEYPPGLKPRLSMKSNLLSAGVC